MRYPRLVRVRQHFERPQINDIPAAVQLALEALNLPRTIHPGQTVALTAGSRGIANIPLILKTVADYLKKLGAKPFLVPTMGSHGGGTAEGQREVIESYGITADYVGVPIKASMEVICLGNTPEGYPVYLDKYASEADHIAVIGRIKPHTGFHGPIESGLHKMMMIGLGKHVGAIEYHRILLNQAYDPVVRAVGRFMLAKAPIAFGLGIVENAYDETAHIEAVPPEHFVLREEAMLTLARRWLPKLPFKEADVLIVDEIGKNISGSGMDTNVVGRKRAVRGATPPPNQPEMRFIFVRSLTDKTHGNASCIGLADFTTNRLLQAMDYRATVINCVTSGYPEGANIPVHFETDREVLEAALPIIGARNTDEARIMHIRNTLQVEEVEISEPCLSNGPPQTDFKILGGAKDVTFNSDGNLAGVG